MFDFIMSLIAESSLPLGRSREWKARQRVEEYRAGKTVWFTGAFGTGSAGSLRIGFINASLNECWFSLDRSGRIEKARISLVNCAHREELWSTDMRALGLPTWWIGANVRCKESRSMTIACEPINKQLLNAILDSSLPAVGTDDSR
jgi:hypothetical protein